MSQSTDNIATALAVAQHLMEGAAKAIALVNQARLEGRAITEAELLALASADDVARAQLEAEIAAHRAANLAAIRARTAGDAGQ